MALQIQGAEKPKYDNVFVNLGAFHIEMAFFSMMGKFIAELGGPYILYETQILQKGSLKGFLKGKSYNRGKRVHQLPGLAMEIQHFQSFEQKHSDPDFNIILKHEIVRLNENLARLNQNLSTVNLSKEFKNILDCYNKFSEEIRNGANGLTEQY